MFRTTRQWDLHQLGQSITVKKSDPLRYIGLNGWRIRWHES